MSVKPDSYEQKLIDDVITEINKDNVKNIEKNDEIVLEMIKTYCKKIGFSADDRNNFLLSLRIALNNVLDHKLPVNDSYLKMFFLSIQSSTIVLV